MSILINKNVLSKGWKTFYIMHKDRRVASVREDGTTTVYYPSFMPYNLYLEKAEQNDFDTKLSNLSNFYYWCASRVLTLDRKYAKEIMNSIGAAQVSTDKERALIAISYHALSLTDVYWVRNRSEKISFDDINLFNHSLSGAFSDVSLAGKQLTAENSELIDPSDAAGDVATDGVAPKAWIKENGKFYLLKDGDVRDVEAELLASKIIDCFRISHVSYERSEFDGKTVTKSEIITSPDKGIVSLQYVDIYCSNHSLNLEKLVLSKDGYAYHMMNIVDYLVGNTDRHWANWGFLVDNNTNKIGKLYPLMDYNKAFLSYDTPEGARCLTTSSGISQRKAAEKGVAAVGLNQISEIDPSWFKNEKIKEMFFKRLGILKEIAIKG